MKIGKIKNPFARRAVIIAVIVGAALIAIPVIVAVSVAVDFSRELRRLPSYCSECAVAVRDCFSDLAQTARELW